MSCKDSFRKVILFERNPIGRVVFEIKEDRFVFEVEENIYAIIDSEINISLSQNKNNDINESKP